jgi:hypothetical protein
MHHMNRQPLGAIRQLMANGLNWDLYDFSRNLHSDSSARYTRELFLALRELARLLGKFSAKQLEILSAPAADDEPTPLFEVAASLATKLSRDELAEAHALARELVRPS